MPESYVDFSAATTVGTGGYTAGSGVLNVASTGSPFPSAATFSVVITDASTGATKVLLRVSAVNSGTQWAVAAEGTDANANHLDNVYAVLSASALDQIRADCNQFGTRANLPSTTGQKTGNRYKCTDSPYEFIYDGTAWRPFIFGYRVDEPLSSNFSWLNQGGASIITSKGGINLVAPPNSGDAIRAQQQSTISTPYTCDMAIMPAIRNANYYVFGMCAIASSSGKIVDFALYNDSGGYQLIRHEWSSSTNIAGSTTPNMSPFQPYGPLIWMRWYDDGTNRNFYLSTDGVYFGLVFQETNSTYITPNEIGFMIDLNNSTSSTWVNLWVVHWNLYSGAPPTYGYSL